MSTDNISFLVENGMPISEIERLLNQGISLEEIVRSARGMIDRGESIVPESAVKAAVPEFFEDKRFLHNVMGDYLIENYGVCKINGTVHIYDNGIYKPGEDALYGFMVELLPSISDARRREVYKYIKVSRRTPVKELSPPHLIPFRHRIYNMKSGEFLDYSKQYVFLNRFPWDYDPEAPECGTVTQALNAIANNDADVVKLLLEAFGNCFYMLNQYRGAVMLYGPGGSNGKSTLLNMLKRLLGAENASFLSLQDTAEKFRLVEVYGKAVNIGDDISDAYLPDSSTFKRLVTGESIMAEKKGRDPITFNSYAKLFFAMNALPPVSDKSRAFFSRLLLIPMNADFSTPGKRDPNMKDKLWSAEEMSYLVRLSMDGLKRLTAQGDFTRPACVQKAMREYEVENNPVIGFLTEYENPTNKPTLEVYRDFQNWCHDNGHKNIVTHSKFSREVCRQCGLGTKSRRDTNAASGFTRYFADAV